MKFVVDRSKWRCGGYALSTQCGKGSTRLLNQEGFMCCLGHCALQLGTTQSDILDKGMPHHTNKIIRILSRIDKEHGFLTNSTLSKKLLKLMIMLTLL